MRTINNIFLKRVILITLPDGDNFNDGDPQESDFCLDKLCCQSFC